MKKTQQGYQCSATDLSKFLSCTYATRMDLEVAGGMRKPPDFTDPHYFTIEQLGLEHERRFVEALREEGLSITELQDDSLTGTTHVQRTLEAMQQGFDIIVQAAFEADKWHGKADILKKVARPGTFGNWSYEVMDTKLGQETKAGSILQLCVYSDMLASLQGVTPELLHIVKPGDPFHIESYRYDDFSAYYRWIRNKMEGALARNEVLADYPDPVSYCDTCRWWSECDKRRRKDDHLTFVAGLHGSHTKELRSQKLDTLQTFASAPSIAKPRKGNIETLQRLQKQAQIQLKQRESNVCQFEYLGFGAGEGLARLPNPNPGDLFFDIEGDHFFPHGGIEYLLGIAFQYENEWQYTSFRGFNRTDEKAAFAQLMEFILARQKEYPDFHIYHFAPYEPSALKHLMLRHSIYAEELDSLLRAGKFIDLHQVLKESIRAGVEKYGLKEMEVFFDFKREMALKAASQALRNVQRALELNVTSRIVREDLDTIAAYNKEDCISTAQLRDWLEQCRAECIDRGIQIERPLPRNGDAKPETKEREARVKAVMEPLLRMLPQDMEHLDEDQKAVLLLSNLLDYFRREEKSAYWEILRINDLEPDELLDERKVAYGLQYVGIVQVESKKKDPLPVHRYKYPPQEFSGDEDDRLEEISLAETGRRAIGSIHAHDIGGRTLDVKKRGDSIDIHPTAVQVNDLIGGKIQEAALLQFALNLIEDGIEGTGKYQAGRDLLFRRLPRFQSDAIHSVDTADITTRAIRFCGNLNNSVLAVQGPPGTGKTYNGAQMILALHTQGKRIGIAAVSHKVIDNLLKWVHDIAKEKESHILLAHKDKDKGPFDFIEYFNDNKVVERLDRGYVIGGTSFLWSTDAMEEQLDYLFIDEAGQMSLAYALSICRSTRNIVLLGDPQQLDQPQKAAHPEGADVSALQHYIGTRKVIEDTRGLFLSTTWRLHPGICAFTSQQYYENKLHHRSGLEQQILSGNPHLGKDALVYIPVIHNGNSNYAPEEIDSIAAIVDKLLVQGTSWTDVSPKGTSNKPLCEKDIMIIAPYNAQVSALRRRLPALHIGTVDKFQGQETAVVIYSMTSSSAEDAPRGMSFLYRPNRLNVASSRAKCLFILVASPKLLEPECRTPEQMQMANGLCAFREMVQID